MSEDTDICDKITLMALGNTAVGKTSFILRFTDNTFQEVYLSTIGLDFKTKIIKIKNKKYKIYFYDTSGQERYKALSRNMIKNADGFIVIYDITNTSSFDSIPEWIQNIRDQKGDDCPITLAGNKIDIENQRKITEEEGKKLANQYGIGFFEISSKSNINVQEAGIFALEKIIEKRGTEQEDEYNGNSKTKGTQLSSKKKGKKNCC